MPKSFRYYTFLLNYIKENIEVEKAEFFSLKKSMQQHFHKEAMSEFLDGLINPPEEVFSLKQAPINKKLRKEVDHRFSNHS